MNLIGKSTLYPVVAPVIRTVVSILLTDVLSNEVVVPS